jgi:hypothetical protein
MKKILFMAIFILTGLYVSAQNGVQDAVIEQITGTIEIKQPRETSFKPASAGEKIFQETVISSSFRSFAIIRVGSTTITVRPLTTLSLTEIQNLNEDETLNVNLQAGRIRVDVKPAAGTRTTTTVSTPSVTASVRGTNFEIDTDNLYVNEGVVSFSGKKGQSMLVGAGGSSRVEHSGQVTNPRDERNSNLMPPNPVGSNAGDSIASGISQEAHFIFELDFQ